MSKKNRNKLMMYQDGGIQMRQPTGMMMPQQPGGLIPFQTQGSGGVISNFMENLRLAGQVAISEKRQLILQQTAEAYSHYNRMLKEQALAPYEIRHAIAMMKHELKERKAILRKLEADIEQVRVATVGIGLDNKLKEVKVATALMELELLKHESDFKKRTMEEG